MGSSLILANSLGLLAAPKSSEPTATSSASTGVPPALHRTDVKEKKAAMPTLPSGDVDRKQLTETLQHGAGWFDKEFSVRVNAYQYYYLYSLERYRSFEDYLSGQSVEQPDWYNKGFEFLKSTQAPDGSWSDSCGARARRRSRSSSCCDRRNRASKPAWARGRSSGVAACRATCPR